MFSSQSSELLFFCIWLPVTKNWPQDVREKAGNVHYASAYCAHGLQIPNQSALHMKVPQ